MIPFIEFAVVLVMAPYIRRAIARHRVYWHIRQSRRPLAGHTLVTGPHSPSRLW